MRLHLLESKNYVNGGNVQISLRDLPARHKVKAFVLRFEAVITTGAAAVLIPGKELFRLFSAVQIEPLLKTSGMVQHVLNWLARGAEEYLPASIPATNASAFRRTISLVIPYADFMSVSPGDTCPETESFRDAPLSIDFAAFSALDTGSNNWNNLASIAGTLRVYAALEENDQTAASLLRFGFVDWAGQQAVLERGLYTHLALVKETGAAFTDAEVSSLMVAVDGKRVIDQCKPQELAYLFDQFASRGGDFHTDSATAPIAGEQLEDEPGAAAGAPALVTLPWIPIIFPGGAYKLTKQVEATENVRVDFTGSLSAFRFAYRRIEPRSEAQAVAGMRAMGAPVTSASQVMAKTESKAPLSAGKLRETRYLPLRAKV